MKTEHVLTLAAIRTSDAPVLRACVGTIFLKSHAKAVSIVFMPILDSGRPIANRTAVQNDVVHLAMWASVTCHDTWAKPF